MPTRNRKSVLGDNPFEPTGISTMGTSPAPAASPAPGRRAANKKKSPASARKARHDKRRAPPRVDPTDTQPAASLPDDPATVAVETAGHDDAAAATQPSVDQETAAIEEARRREVEAKIRELENRIEAMGGDGASGSASDAAPSPHPPGTPPGTIGRGDGSVLGTAREMLSSDYYLRQWGRISMRNRSEMVDEFGYDPRYDARVRPLLELLYSRYFRSVTEGIEHIPSTGRALIVVNHSGTFPYDGVMLKTAVRKEHPAARQVRWLSEDQIFYLPFVGSFMTRLGSVRACQENAERLLANDSLVAVFPEGAKGMGRLYRDRYRLQRFGRGGFIRLCLRTQTPIVPCVIVGAEESMPLMARIEYLTGPLGLPYLPITPTFPLLGPLGLLPAPTRWSFMFGPPIQLDGYGPETADDQVLVGRLTERVRATMQTMLDRALSARRSIWFG